MSLDATLLEDVLEFAPDAMFIVNAAGTVIYANRQASTLFGMSRESVVDQSVDRLLPERFRRRHQEHRHRFSADGRMRPMGAGLQLFGQKADGTEFPVEVSLSPLQGGLTAAAIRDVTAHKSVERELITAREAANIAREAADRANTAKSRFLATASHDLRQPLQALALLNGLLRRMNLDDEVARAIGEQERAINSMKRLLNALLDISKLDSGAIKPNAETFPINALFKELSNEFAAIATEKGLQLRDEAPELYVHSDPALVEQILRNLLSNAIKYTRSGLVRLHAWQTDTGICIEVADSGIGIPADKLSLIFDEFFQIGVAANATREGYGLGLSIVQRIASLLGFKLQVQSTPGKGSTFAFEVPRGLPELKPDEMRTNAAADHSAAHRKSTTALIVDDNEGVRTATRMFLQLENFRVLEASSISGALQCVYDGNRFDILVTDYHLEKSETGIDVIVALRAALGRDIPAVLVTGDTSAAVKKLRYGDHVSLVSKPIRPEELLISMDKLLDEQNSACVELATQPSRTSHL